MGRRSSGSKPIPPIVNGDYEASVAVDRLRLHPRNANQGDIGAIHESIEVNGFFGACLAQRSTGYILTGNHRYVAATQHGIPALPVIWIDCDDEAALRIMLADNRTTSLGSDNQQILAELLTEIASTDKGLSGTGFDGDYLDDLLSTLAGGSANSGDGDDKPAEDYKSQWSVIVECENEERQAHLLQRLMDDGYTCKALVA